MTSQHDLHLTEQECAMLEGKQGRAIQRAIEIVVALAKIYGAQRLVPVTSVQVAGVSFKNLGEAGLEFLREWAGQGARVIGHRERRGALAGVRGPRACLHGVRSCSSGHRPSRGYLPAAIATK